MFKLTLPSKSCTHKEYPHSPGCHTVLSVEFCLQVNAETLSDVASCFVTPQNLICTIDSKHSLLNPIKLLHQANINPLTHKSSSVVPGKGNWTEPT